MTDFIYNDATIDAYNQQFYEYIKNTPHDYNERHKFFLHWIDTSLAQIPRDGLIFEVGSGHGRDARYIASKGYNILRTDASQSFVDYLNGLGERTKQFNILRDELKGLYDMVYADGVMPHFQPQDADLVLHKIYSALKPGGIFTFDVKQGTGEDWISEKNILRRYTFYWDPDKLKTHVLKAGYEIVLFKADVMGGDLPNRIWIHVIARKPL